MAVPETWAGEKRLYEKQFYAVLRRRTKVIDIPPEEEELGYTSSDGNIHEAYEHPIMHSLSVQQQVMFRYGVFTHETLHQVFTSFSYLETVLNRHRDPVEKQIISLFANLVEDPSIEYYASEVFGGEMLEALRFSIRHIYRMTPPLSESTTPFTQFINALVMFGDMGLIKGTFTFPEAEEYFRKIAPEFNRMVVCPDPHARIDAAEQWMFFTRPLWEKEQETTTELSRQIQQLLDELMNGGMKGNGDAKEIPEHGCEDERSMRRDNFAKAIEESQKDTGEESTAGAGSHPEPSAEASSPAEGAENPAAADARTNETASGNAGSVPRNKKGTIPSCFVDDGKRDEEIPASPVTEILWERVKQESDTISRCEEDTLNLPVALPKAFGKGTSHPLRCQNNRIQGDAGTDNLYGRTVYKLSKEIRALSNGIRILLRADYDDYMRSTSGRYALKRDLAHTSVKIFDRKKEKKNIDDMAVLLLIDISGSMRGTKILLARETSIILAEAFASLKIPCYIMGFTADFGGMDVIHNHYVSWSNTKEERASLLQLQATSNNDDGYSIRYASQILKKKPAEHKILFVISDGAPACSRYRYTDGIQDTAAAIREAKRNADVCGIGIGICNSTELKAMYNGAYTDVYDVTELPVQLAKQLKHIIRTWL